MSDRLFPLSIAALARWIQAGEKQGSLFGIDKKLFFEPKENDPFRTERYGQMLETPLGAAAGPHTQMAANIVCAWLCGARFIELKTVQALDELQVTKPCIDMQDEGYNCEWSQELKLEHSFHQYLDAWIMLHLLRHRFSLPDAQGPGFIFNMSVGYDLEGILKENVQRFLARMSDCKEEKEEKIAAVAKSCPQILDIAIPDTISDNITLSTMHGCPPDEIEAIAMYLIKERGLHTAVKLNPTLLGAEELRDILNKKLGFAVDVPDDAFAHDLKYDNAKRLIANLKQVAQTRGVSFSLKLSNTLECVNRRAVLPETEKMIYMSGRALHPIVVQLALKLQRDFSGTLDISFCGGADCFNSPELLACGLTPVTVCSDLLKPGGYGRLGQYLEELQNAMREQGAVNTEQYILHRAEMKEPDETAVHRATLKNLERYAARVSEERVYHKGFFPERSIKSKRPLYSFDCIEAPCSQACATCQDVSGYMHHTAQGEYRKALAVILKDNPFPATTGMVCDHLCQAKCTRLQYDSPLHIRSIKRFIERHHLEEIEAAPEKSCGFSVAVIGAGPSGLSCAYFLARVGFKVDVYEAERFPGGMAAAVIPRFRIGNEQISRDVCRIETLGVTIRYDSPIDRKRFRELQERYDYIYLAVGAQKDRELRIRGEELPGIKGALAFLSSVRNNRHSAIGKRVAVIGGGNSAVDAARTARRLVGAGGEVAILYRRMLAQMPAGREEVAAAQAEGIAISELVAPTGIRRQGSRLQLACVRTRLGAVDKSGRKRPIPIEGSRFTLDFDTIITAVGQDVRLDFLPDNDLKPDPASGRTALDNVFIGGDALRGPASIVSAVGDGKRAAKQIMQAAGIEPSSQPSADEKPGADIAVKRARRVYGEAPPLLPVEKRNGFDIVEQGYSEAAAQKEASRCLSCADICDICVTVCPNRANISYRTAPVHYRLQKIVFRHGKPTILDAGVYRVEQKYQVLNIADLCNRCGNCRTSCPSGGAPYEDKPRLCLGNESFDAEENAYIFAKDGQNLLIKAKKNGTMESLTCTVDAFIYESPQATVTLDRETFGVKEVEMKAPKKETARQIDLSGAADMSVLLAAVPESCPYLLPAETEGADV